MAFELGRTPQELKETLLASDYDLIGHYTNKRYLPSRRIELQLARVCQLIAQTMGGAKNAKLSDFLFDPIEVATQDEIEDIKNYFGFKPRK